MNGVEVLLASIKFTHGFAATVVGDCTPETLSKRVAGGNVNAIGAILAHAVGSEDFFVQRMMKNEPLIFVSGGWGAKTGINLPDQPQQSPDWTDGVKVDWATFMPYAQAVFASTESYIAGLSESDLDRVIEAPFGKQPLGAFLASIGTFHFTEHLGEIAALKGVQGLKGLPF
jgi:DinB superfamily